MSQNASSAAVVIGTLRVKMTKKTNKNVARADPLAKFSRAHVFKKKNVVFKRGFISKQLYIASRFYDVTAPMASACPVKFKARF